MNNDCCAVRISGEKTTRTRFEERYFKVQKFFRSGYTYIFPKKKDFYSTESYIEGHHKHKTKNYAKRCPYFTALETFRYEFRADDGEHCPRRK